MGFASRVGEKASAEIPAGSSVSIGATAKRLCASTMASTSLIPSAARRFRMSDVGTQVGLAELSQPLARSIESTLAQSCVCGRPLQGYRYRRFDSPSIKR